mgnify:CR=1 FL=1
MPNQRFQPTAPPSAGPRLNLGVRPHMSEQTTIREFLVAISRLPEDRRRRTDAWYESQKEHWLGWLLDYNSPGAYNRKITSGRTAKDVYNHIVCPELLTYLADASGVSRRLVKEARQIERAGGTQMRRAGQIRKRIPWAVVHEALTKNGFLPYVV